MPTGCRRKRREEYNGDLMVGEIFHPDTLAMQSARNAAAQAMARQNTSILNIEAARAEALRHVEKGRFTTVPTSVGTTIMRSNAIGYSAPSVSSRNLTPNGPVQRAMSPSMQTPPGANISLFTNAQTSVSTIK